MSHEKNPATDQNPAADQVTGLFGGTFDPLHLGHYYLIRQLLDLGHIEQAIFLPAAIPPHKRHLDITPGHHRLAMLKAAIESDPDCCVSDYELAQADICYTVDTAHHFRSLYGENLRLVIGMDSLQDLHKWVRSDELVANNAFLVYARPGYPQPDLEELHASFGRHAEKLLANIVETKQYDISSTDVRQRIAAGIDVSDLLPPAVWDYIQHYRLYRSNL